MTACLTVSRSAQRRRTRDCGTLTGTGSRMVPRIPTATVSPTRANCVMAPNLVTPIPTMTERTTGTRIPTLTVATTVEHRTRARCLEILRPSLSAPRDRPRSWYACHQKAGHSAARVCVVGSSGPKVVLFGDSHALQWRAALERVARSRGWRVYFLTKSACPVARIRLPSKDCAKWRRNALDLIRKIHPAMVIASNMDQYPVADAVDDADRDRRWREGLTWTLKALRRSVPKVVLLGDTPRWNDPTLCLPAHLDDMSACSRRRLTATGMDRVANDRAAAVAAGARFVKTVGLTCPYDPCPLVIGRLLVVYDSGHMTVAFSSTIWRGLRAALPGP